MEKGRSKRALGWSVAIGLIVLIALAWWAQRGEAADALRGDGLTILAATLPLTVAGYAARFVKWHRLVRRRAPMPAGPDLEVFLCGLVLSLTPAKAGELWKAWAIRRELGLASAAPLVPVVLVERMTDLVAIAALSVLGLGLVSDSRLLVLAAALVLVAGLVALRWERPWMAIAQRLRRHERFHKLGDAIDSAIHAARDLTLPAPLTAAVVLSALAWVLEGASLWLALRMLGDPLALPLCVGIFAISTLVGALSFVPGGFGAAEIGMVGLLGLAHVGAGVAAAATVLVRLSTLWFGVLLGALAFAFRFRRLRNQPAAAPEPSA